MNITIKTQRFEQKTEIYAFCLESDLVFVFDAKRNEKIFVVIFESLSKEYQNFFHSDFKVFQKCDEF